MNDEATTKFDETCEAMTTVEVEAVCMTVTYARERMESMTAYPLTDLADLPDGQQEIAIQALCTIALPIARERDAMGLRLARAVAEVERLRGVVAAHHAVQRSSVGVPALLERLRDDIRRGLRIAHDLTPETQSVEEMAADLVRQVREARASRDAWERIVHAMRAARDGWQQAALAERERCAKMVQGGGRICRYSISDVPPDVFLIIEDVARAIAEDIRTLPPPVLP